MAHPVVAEAHGQKKLRVDHGGPELDLDFFAFFEAPGVVGSLDDAALDRALKIDPAKFVLTSHPGDHAKLEPPAGARARRDFDPCLERTVDQRRFARRGADFLERLNFRREAGAVTREAE